MKQKQLLSVALLTFAPLLFTGCGEDNPPPAPASDTLDVAMDMALKGYPAGSTASGTFGVALTETEALTRKATITGGTYSWQESGSGKDTKRFTIPQRKKGEKLWVFLVASRKATGSQSISLNWPVSHSATVTAATDSAVVTSFVVGQ